MITALICLAYGVGAGITFRLGARRLLRNMHEQNASWRQVGRTARNDIDRPFLLIMALAVAVFWPLAGPIWAGMILLLRADISYAPQELAARDREELERLRKLAKDYDLPMPEDQR